MFNNVTRTGIEALAATHGGTQSLHTNALDEAIALPTDFSARIARNTQLFIQQETGTCRTIDPWGGSHYVERLTYDLIRKAQAHIAEVEELGGMAKAIAAGIPKMRIEEAAARTQARIDSGTQTIVGVNKFQVTDEAQIEVLKVDNKTVRESQIAKLQRLKGERDPTAVAAALAALTEAARSGAGNLLERAVAAARAKATVGEISDAMEKVWGRHRAETRAVSGVYTAEAGAMSKDVDRVRRMCEAFAANDGRRPRILVAKMGQDGHDRGQKVIASRVRRSRLRRRHRPAVRHARRGRAPGGGERRAHPRRVVAGGRPPDAGAGPDGGAGEGRPRRHHDRGRRRHPAGRLPCPVRRRRQGRIRSGHQHPPRRRRPPRASSTPSWATAPRWRRSSGTAVGAVAPLRRGCDTQPAPRISYPMNTPFAVRQDGKFSVEEYLALIESRPEEERWQLIDGVAMMMPPPTRMHQLIASNLAFELNTHFRAHRPELCALQEVGLIVPKAELFRPEADVAVVDLIGDYESYIDKFYSVAEVLSDSNTDKDIAVKRQRYLQHPENLYFLLIEQKRVRVEVVARAGGWQPVVLDQPEATLDLPAFGFSARVADLYRGTPLLQR